MDKWPSLPAQPWGLCGSRPSWLISCPTCLHCRTVKWHKRGLLQWRDNKLPVSSETSVGVYWWEFTTLERPCSVTLVDHLRGVMRNRKHNSWGKFATSIECESDISAVLTVKSGLNFFMISGVGNCRLFRGLVWNQMESCDGAWLFRWKSRWCWPRCWSNHI